MSFSPIAPLVIYTTTGDSAPSITFSLKRLDNTIPDLTGATVRFVIADPRTSQHTNAGNDTCTITNATGGICVYNWATAGTDCPHAGAYDARLRIFYSGGIRESAKITVVADDDV